MTDLRVLKNGDELAANAAMLFFRKLEAAIRSNGIFSVVLSGGDTPVAMFEQIAKTAPKQVNWDKVHFFWADERAVPQSDPQSNFKLARTHLLDHLPVPAANIHRFRTELGSPEKVVADYERELRSFFIEQGEARFDLVFMGLGEDGHTASLFAKAKPSFHELARTENWVAAVNAPGLKTPGRFTLTPAALNSAAKIVFLVTGRKKAAILENVLQTDGSNLPACLIAPTHGKLLWFADQAAAGELAEHYTNSPRAALPRIANQLRIHSIRATTAAGSGHPTSCCSAADLVAALFFSEMRFDPEEPHFANNDRFILSKGHAAPLLYAAWAETGHFDPAQLETLRKMDSPFEGHPTPRLDFVDVATGSLGQGLSAGVGMAIGAKISKLSFRTYVLLGDGELAEGSVWEAASLAGTRKLGSLCAILDINRLGQSQETAFGRHADIYRARFEAFGWRTFTVNGHSIDQILEVLEQASQSGDRPCVIIAETVKGKGILIAEDKDGWHGKALTKEQAREAIEHLEMDAQSAEGWRPKLPEPLNAVAFPLTGVPTPMADYPQGKEVSTRKAAGNALARLGEHNGKLVVLDGDVENSTYTEFFGKRYPERFIECFISEQNMLAASMGLAALGWTAFSSTFASFVSRAYDQLRMAGISRSNIKLIGTHAGISIGEDGPSQMALEDLAAIRAIAGSHIFYPCDAVSTERCVELMASERGIFYLRASRPDTPILYPTDEVFEVGGAKILKQTGQDRLTVVAAGIAVFEALKAREISAEQGFPFTVIDAYSIKPLARDLILSASRATRNPGLILTVEDHYVEGGLGDAVAGELSREGARVHKLAVRELPRSGSKDELLARYGIDAQAILAKALELAERGRKISAA